MRPDSLAVAEELYECFECGARVEAPTGRRCESCGGTLRNIARPRDL